MKIITICGSYKFVEKMKDIYKQLTDLGYIVFLPAIDCSKHKKEQYMKLHYEKIALSDAVFIVDAPSKNAFYALGRQSYVGDSTLKEIDKAVKLEKEVIFYSNNDIGVI